jgi:hypothetical protein
MTIMPDRELSRRFTGLSPAPPTLASGEKAGYLSGRR